VTATTSSSSGGGGGGSGSYPVAPYVDLTNNQEPMLNQAATQAGLKAFSAAFVIGSGCTGLVVSVTIPVNPNGPDANGQAFLQEAKANSTRIDVIDVMTMDYYGSWDTGGANMGTAGLHPDIHPVHGLTGRPPGRGIHRCRGHAYVRPGPGSDEPAGDGPISIPGGQIAITPDGKTIYIACPVVVVPISTVSNLPGQPIRIAPGYPMAIAIKP
jgi:hypothetical protein